MCGQAVPNRRFLQGSPIMGLPVFVEMGLVSLDLCQAYLLWPFQSFCSTPE